MKKSVLFILLNAILLSSCTQKDLPKPENGNGIRGKQFGIDKNINEETIDNYLNRNDVCYRDMRMLIDPANYEAIGGDSNLSGYIKGFKVVPFPYICTPFDLPNEVGNTYQGETLFSFIDNIYVPNYFESMDLLIELFPKDLNIFLMCGGGGYAKMMKDLLISLGWDKDKIYNVGGYWFYEGKNKIEVKEIDENNNVTYNFDLVDYYEFDFSKLTKNK